MRFAVVMTLMLAVLPLGTACAPRTCETVSPTEPERSTVAISDWVPDESLEVAKVHEIDPPEVDPHADLSEDERMEKAKVLYEQAEAHWASEEWREAEVKYEEAYHLVPGKHGFAYKVAMAAVKAGDCAKARVFLEHFIIYGDIERQKPLILEARTEHRKLTCW